MVSEALRASQRASLGSGRLLAGLVVILAALLGFEDGGADDIERPEAVGLGDPGQGKIAISTVRLHKLPPGAGYRRSRARVRPALDGIARRKYIAGVLPNTPENMVRWIQNPKDVDPLTAMPDMGVKEYHARDMAAHLYTLD